MRLTDEQRNAIVEDAARVFGPGARVRLHDPAALPAARALLHDQDVDFCDDPYALANGADALVLATPWPEYGELDLQRIAERMRQPVLVDARNLMKLAELRATGFRGSGIGQGRGTSAEEH